MKSSGGSSHIQSLSLAPNVPDKLNGVETQFAVPDVQLAAAELSFANIARSDHI